MALPKISQPTYKIYLHTLKKEVEYRPYTVGEEKILAMIAESKDPKFIAGNIRKIMQDCILDPSVRIETLMSYDIENLLLKIRGKSSGEVVDLKYTDPDNGKKYKFSINLDELDVTFNEDHSYTIEIDETTGLKMKDLTFERMLEYQSRSIKANDDISQAELTYDSIIDCIESIYDENEVYTVGVNTTRAEVKTFVENLRGISNKLYKFLETMPAIIYDLKLDDDKVVQIRDIKSFL